MTNLEHRGAAGADPETGDGAGILVQMPDEFFRSQSNTWNTDLPKQGQYGVGMTFLPMDTEVSNECKQIIEKCISEENMELLQWRAVPVDTTKIGVLANQSRPTIEQFFVQSANEIAEQAFEIKLFILRRSIEKAVAETISPDYEEDFYICSLSCNKIVYKGLVMTHQLEGFYPDLVDPDFKTSFSLVHSRFSTNTLGTWKFSNPMI